MTQNTAGRPRFLASLRPSDRRLLLGLVALLLLVTLVVAFLTPPQDDNDPLPSTFAYTSHGARAAYLALAESGYRMERWERPLAEMAGESDSHTVLILADPGMGQADAARAAIAKVLEHGGRVLATGYSGALLLPQAHATPKPGLTLRECGTQAEGMEVLADSGKLHMRPQAVWSMDDPAQHVQYTCNEDAVVVSYAVGQGQVVWWADAEPLENSEVAEDGDLALLLNSIGPAAGSRVVWDESLHEASPGVWSYAQGTPMHLLWWQLGLTALLLVLSSSRRSGPLLPDPVVARDAPLEFVHSLGALYDKADATNTAVRIAYDRFRLLLGRQTAPRAGRSVAESAQEMISVVNARLGRVPADLQDEVLTCEEAAYQSESLPSRRALALVQALWSYEEELSLGGNRFARADSGEASAAAQGQERN